MRTQPQEPMRIIKRANTHITEVPKKNKNIDAFEIYIYIYAEIMA